MNQNEYEKILKTLDKEIILDDWFERIMQKAERYKGIHEKEVEENKYTYKAGLAKGFEEGLIMATSLLSLSERKAVRRYKKDNEVNHE
ncbi:hypothetical protein H8J86_07985 [Clostridium perfringens]|uniref:hypothetical protein n=1 Tax=Clostridium perfringens TaxID=1502 RepID=UPI0018E44878|nr:hypothetical protein [Clostridium perfringens]MBI6005891.1 hypothetical protein [Clostridium perfringens]